MNLSLSSGKYRKELENFIITINGEEPKEQLISIANELYIELYDLNNKKATSESPISTLIGT